MEEYLIARVTDVCRIPYSFAYSIVMDLEQRDLEESLLIYIENGTIETYEDLHTIFY